MTTIDTPTRTLPLRLRPLAACLAALSAAAMATPVQTRPTAPPLETPRAPSSVVVSTCDDSGAGSLRDAVNQAVSGDTIDLTGLTCSQISLTTGAIAIGQSQLAFVGPGRNELSIDAAGSPGYSAFYHLGGGTLIFENMTIENGSKYRTDHDAHGGCVYSNGNVIMRHVTVQNCVSKATNGHHSLGGGIYTSGMTYLSDSRVTGNIALSTNSYASGGGVYALGGFQSMYTQISANSAYTPTSANTWGGGVFARGVSFILGTEISRNSAVNMGGAALADNAGATVTMINSTVSGNVATKIGGMYVRSPLHMYSSTVAFNSSAIWNDGAGHYFAAGLQIGVSGYMQSSILSNNTVPGVGTPGDIFDISGVANTGILGNQNIIMEFNIGIPNDTSHDDPLLGPLQDNGGTTRTHRPGAASWAINSGNNMGNMQYDQRGPGFPRRADGGAADIGAYETDFDVIFVNGFN